MSSRLSWIAIRQFLTARESGGKNKDGSASDGLHIIGGGFKRTTAMADNVPRTTWNRC